MLIESEVYTVYGFKIVRALSHCDEVQKEKTNYLTVTGSECRSLYASLGSYWPF